MGDDIKEQKINEQEINEQEIKERLELDRIRDWTRVNKVNIDQYDKDMMFFYCRWIKECQEKRRMKTDPVQRKEYSEFVDLCIRRIERINTDPRNGTYSLCKKP